MRDDLLPLSDLRVLELDGGIAGAFCGKLLGAFGAEIVKVEAPTGDPQRGLGPFASDRPAPESSLPFLYLNTGKQSVTLDVRSADGLDMLRRLVGKADVVIDGSDRHREPAVEAALSGLAASSPALIFTSIQDFGEGPYRDYLGGELVLLALGGLLNMVGEPDREPVRLGGYQAQYTTGLSAFTGTLAAICERDLSGHGQRVDISAVETVAFTEWKSSTFYQARGQVRGRGGRDAQWAVLRCSDGFVAFVYQDPNWPAVQRLIGDERLLEERFAAQTGRLAHRDTLREILEGWTLPRTKLDIYHTAQSFGIPVGMVADVSDVVASPQYQVTQYFDVIEHPTTGAVAYPGIPCTLDGVRPTSTRAPLLGEHNQVVYSSWLQLDLDQIADLRARQII